MLEGAGQLELTHRSRLSAHDREELHRRPQRHPARLHAGGRGAGRDGIDRHERREDRPWQHRWRGVSHHRGQGISRTFPDHWVAGARGAHLIAGAGDGNGRCREILRHQRAAIQKRSEEDRLKPRQGFAFRDWFGLLVFAGAAVFNAALLRSASLRSMGMPCFLSTSAKASSASS